MKKLYNISLGILMALGLFSCAKDAPFQVEPQEGTGRLLKSTLAVEVKGLNPITKAVVNGVPGVVDFKVEFINPDNSSVIKAFDRYDEMPEVVELTQGKYNIRVSFGGEYGGSGKTAAFNTPHYYGESRDFSVEVDKIVSNLDPVVCNLQNVRVKIIFDESLTSSMSSDSKVSVQVGQGTTILDFNKDTEYDGFFEFNKDYATLIATFNGKVENLDVRESKVIENISAGNYYKITFSLKPTDSNNPGNIVIPGIDNDNNNEEGNGFVIDTDVTINDLNNDSSYNDDVNQENPGDSYLDDDKRPENGEDPNNSENKGNDENNGQGVVTPEPTEKSLSVSLTEGINEGKEGYNKVTNEEPFTINGLSTCNIHVETENGIKEFKIYIESDAEGFEGILKGAFGDCINLVEENEGFEGGWEELLAPTGLPLGVGGYKTLDLDLCNFFPFLSFFKGNHTFTIYIEDTSGSNEPLILNMDNK